MRSLDSATDFVFKMFVGLTAIAFLLLFGTYIKDEVQLNNTETRVGIVDEKYIGEEGDSTRIIPVGKAVVPMRIKRTYYAIIVDDMAFKVERSEWNKINVGDEITYKFLDKGDTMTGYYLRVEVKLGEYL